MVFGSSVDIARNQAVLADFIIWPAAALACVYFAFETVHRFRQRYLVVFSAEGICDSRIGKGVVPWVRIRNVELKERTAFSETAAELEVDTPAQYCDARWYNALRGWFLPRIAISGRSLLRVYIARLNARPGAIYTAIVERWSAYRN